MELTLTLVPFHQQSRLVVDLTYFYTPIYSFLMLAVLNSRTELYSWKFQLDSKDKDIRPQPEPQWVFTVDFDKTAVGTVDENRGLKREKFDEPNSEQDCQNSSRLEEGNQVGIE